jgi:hypothetical protein
LAIDENGADPRTRIDVDGPQPNSPTHLHRQGNTTLQNFDLINLLVGLIPRSAGSNPGTEW